MAMDFRSVPTTTPRMRMYRPARMNSQTGHSSRRTLWPISDGECPPFDPLFAGSGTELVCHGSWRLLCLHCLDNRVGKFRRSRSATHVARQLAAVPVYVIERIANFLRRFVLA